MKKCGTLAIFLLLFINSRAQQNLFNIPSGDINPKSELFYQQQFNFYKVNQLESKTHLVYGLGRRWDAGVNLVDLPVNLSGGPVFTHNDSTTRKPLYPVLLFTLQKQWEVSSQFEVNVGTQVGTNLTDDIRNSKPIFFNYAITRWTPNKHLHLVGGLYHTNDNYVGGSASHVAGFMLGYEYKITKKLLLMGDFISGNHKKSTTVLGGGYTFGDRVQLFVGALLGFPNRQLQNGVVLELNWFGWNFMEE
jgi:hypothetical protein